MYMYMCVHYMNIQCSCMYMHTVHNVHVHNANLHAHMHIMCNVHVRKYDRLICSELCGTDISIHEASLPSYATCTLSLGHSSLNERNCSSLCHAMYMYMYLYQHTVYMYTITCTCTCTLILRPGRCLICVQTQVLTACGLSSSPTVPRAGHRSLTPAAGHWGRS